MKKLLTFALMLTGLFAAVSCSNGDKGKEQQPDPFYGLWSDENRNYTFMLTGDTLYYYSYEMDGLELSTAYQKKDDKTIVFQLSDNGHGTVALNPETRDLTLTVDLGEGQETYEIPEKDKFNKATTASNIASTLLYDEDLVTVVDTLRNDMFLTVMGGNGNYHALLLPDGRKGWIDGDKTTLVRGNVSQKFLQYDYAQELLGLTGHPERLESYSFNQIGNGKVGIIFHRIFYNGALAQELYYAGNIDGNHIKVTHTFSDYNDWEEGKMETATPLDKPFEITMVESFLPTQFIRVDKRVFEQREPEY